VAEGREGGGGVRVVPVLNAEVANASRSLSGAPLADVGSIGRLCESSVALRSGETKGGTEQATKAHGGDSCGEGALRYARQEWYRGGRVGSAVERVLDVGRSATRRIWVLVRWAWWVLGGRACACARARGGVGSRVRVAPA